MPLSKEAGDTCFVFSMVALLAALVLFNHEFYFLSAVCTAAWGLLLGITIS